MKRDKTGGRKAGTPNKTTANLRGWVKDFLTNNVEQIERDFKKLNPRDRVFLFEKLLKYTVPQLAATNVKTDLHKLLSEAKESGSLSEDNLKRLAELIVEQHKVQEEQQ